MKEKELKPMNMTIKRTDSNKQIFKMHYTTNMNYIDILQETFYHYDSIKSGFIENYHNYTKFIDSANATKIY